MSLAALRAGLALACALALPLPAAASVVADGSLVTAHAPSGTALFGSADGYAAAANPSLALLGSGFGDIEFLDEAGTLFIDFASDGSLDLYGTPGLSGLFRFVFDGLSAPLVAARLDAAVDGVWLTVLDRDTLELRLDNAGFADLSQPLAAQLEVPAPASAALAALGIVLLAARRRRR